MDSLEAKINGIDMALLRLKIGVFEDVCNRFGEALKSPRELLNFADDLTEWLCRPVATFDIAETVSVLDCFVGELEDRIAKLEQNAAAPGAPVIETGTDAAAPNPAASAEGREAAPGTPPPVILREQYGRANQGDVNPQGGAVAPDIRQSAVGIEPRPQDSLPEIKDGGQHDQIDVVVTSQERETQTSTTPSPAETPTAPGPIVMPPVPLQKHTAIDGAPLAPAASKPTQTERIVSHLSLMGNAGATFPVLAKIVGAPEASIQATLSNMVKDGRITRNAGVGRDRLFFAAGIQTAPVQEVTFQNAVNDADILGFLRNRAKLGAPAVDIWKVLRAKPADVLDRLKELARETRVKAAPSADGMKWFHADFGAHLAAYSPPPPAPPKEVARTHVSQNQTRICTKPKCGRNFRPEFAGQEVCNICRENTRLGITESGMGQ